MVTLGLVGVDGGAGSTQMVVVAVVTTGNGPHGTSGRQAGVQGHEGGRGGGADKASSTNLDACAAPLSEHHHHPSRLVTISTKLTAAYLSCGSAISSREAGSMAPVAGSGTNQCGVLARRSGYSSAMPARGQGLGFRRQPEPGVEQRGADRQHTVADTSRRNARPRWRLQLARDYSGAASRCRWCHAMPCAGEGRPRPRCTRPAARAPPAAAASPARLRPRPLHPRARRAESTMLSLLSPPPRPAQLPRPQ